MYLEKSRNHDAQGAHAVVFFKDGRAIKVFKRQHGEEYVRNVYKDEVAAYERAKTFDQLRPVVSHFVGPTRCCRITDYRGNDISNEFILDCAYEMERIDGDFVEIGKLPFESRWRIERLFEGTGINHINDCSAIIDADGSVRHVIDFAIREYEFTES